MAAKGVRLAIRMMSETSRRPLESAIRLPVVLLPVVTAIPFTHRDLTKAPHFLPFAALQQQQFFRRFVAFNAANAKSKERPVDHFPVCTQKNRVRSGQCCHASPILPRPFASIKGPIVLTMAHTLDVCDLDRFVDGSQGAESHSLVQTKCAGILRSDFQRDKLHSRLFKSLQGLG